MAIGLAPSTPSVITISSAALATPVNPNSKTKQAYFYFVEHIIPLKFWLDC
ncbi:hypothetical protein PH505_bd00050 [Pseudoalteromonas distincta]|nr:hypothetical protein PH505_bd00050 [Pseudoalteromonas distincta]